MFLVRMSSARDDWDAQTTREEAGAEAEAWAEEREGRSVERRVVERETDWRDRLAPPVLVLVLVRELSSRRETFPPSGIVNKPLFGVKSQRVTPKLANISTLFSRVGVASSLWVHLLAVNAFCAVSLMQRGLAAGIPVYHTIVLSMVFGPIGLLSSWVTECLFAG